MTKKYIVILTEKQLDLLQGEVMNEYALCEVEHTRRVFKELKKKINEAVEV